MRSMTGKREGGSQAPENVMHFRTRALFDEHSRQQVLLELAMANVLREQLNRVVLLLDSPRVRGADRVNQCRGVMELGFLSPRDFTLVPEHDDTAAHPLAVPMIDDFGVGVLVVFLLGFPEALLKLFRFGKFRIHPKRDMLQRHRQAGPFPALFRETPNTGAQRGKPVATLDDVKSRIAFVTHRRNGIRLRPELLQQTNAGTDRDAFSEPDQRSLQPMEDHRK